MGASGLLIAGWYKYKMLRMGKRARQDRREAEVTWWLGFNRGPLFTYVCVCVHPHG